ncbi:MAG: hypothetical protein JXQ87_19055 [Bacteroidia bacterium]
MRKVILLLTILLVGISIKAKNTDSLLSIYHSTHQGSSVKIEALEKLIGHGRIVSSIDSSMKYLTLLINLASEAGANETRIKALMAVANIKVFSNELNEANNFRDLADSLTETLNYAYGTALVKSFDGLINSYTGQADKGIVLCLDAFEIMDSLDDLKGKLITSSALISAYALNGDNTKQFYYAKRNVEIAEELGDWVGLSKAYHNMADVYLTIDMGKDGEYYHERSLEYSKKSGNIGEEMNVYDHMATLAFKNGDTEKALDLLLKVEQFYIESKYSLALELVRSRIIYVLVKSGDYTNAQKRIDEFRTEQKSPGLITEFSIGLVHLAEGLIEQHNKDHLKAIEHFKDAHKGISGHAQLMPELWIHQALISSYEAIDMFKEATLHYHLSDSLKIEMQEGDLKKSLQRFEFHRLEVKDSLVKVGIEEEQLKAIKVENERKKRKNRIQYSLIIILVALLATVIAVIAKFSISPKLASGLIFIFFILTFEFLLVVLDPWVDSVSDGEVGWKIAINTAIALALFGIHQVSEKKLKNTILKADR